MEVGFHFIFEIVKVGILASVYATLLLFTIKLITKSDKESWFQRSKINRQVFWIISGATISIFLFLWMFTYWGNHGLGDSARIPIGGKLAIENINWNDYGYIDGLNSTKQDDKLRTSRFTITKDGVTGNLCQYEPNCSNGFFFYRFETGKLTEFSSEFEYIKFANEENLPSINEFVSFEENYRRYWSGWRFWLLP